MRRAGAFTPAIRSKALKEGGHGHVLGVQDVALTRAATLERQPHALRGVAHVDEGDASTGDGRDRTLEKTPNIAGRRFTQVARTEQQAGVDQHDLELRRSSPRALHARRTTCSGSRATSRPARAARARPRRQFVRRYR